MQSEKAVEFNAFMMGAISVYNNVNEKHNKNDDIPEEIRLQFRKTEFELHFQDFLEELQDNIREYRDIKLIMDYTLSCFIHLDLWEGFDNGENQWIIGNGYEVDFLLKFKLSIEKYSNVMTRFISNTNFESEKRCLYYVFKVAMEELEDTEFKHSFEDAPNPNNIPDKDERFDFKTLKTECSKLNTTIDKIKLIHERLFDFEQWQMEFDEEIDDHFGGVFFLFTRHHYPKFKVLCDSELRRLDKMLELERKMAVTVATPAIFQNEPSPYTWNANDTDLIELIAVIHASESIKRIDGNKLLQKELFEYFQGAFNIKLNNIHPTLTKAGNRKTGITPYLDKLKLAFENYVQDKEDKQRLRR